MVKDDRYAGRANGAQRGGVGAGARPAGQDARPAPKQGRDSTQLDKRELLMMAELVQWRINQLTGMAVIDDSLHAQRESWIRLLRKLDRGGRA